MASFSKSARKDLGPQTDPGSGSATQKCSSRGTDDVSTSTPTSHSVAVPPSPGSNPPLACEAASAAATAASKREKARVHFNSSVAVTKPHGVKFETPKWSEPHDPPSPKSRPSISSVNSCGSIVEDLVMEPNTDAEKAPANVAVPARARHLTAKGPRDSPPRSRASMESCHKSDDTSLDSINPKDTSRLNRNHTREFEDDQATLREEAYDLVKAHSQRFPSLIAQSSPQASIDASHAKPNPVDEGLYDGVYHVPPPQRYRGGVLSQLLKLNKPAEFGASGFFRNRTWSSSTAGGVTPPSLESGTVTPNGSRRKWYEYNRSHDTLATLEEASTRLANPNQESQDPISPGKKRPAYKRRSSSGRLSIFRNKEDVRIRVHIAETLSRQKYIIKLCKALMLYGAPSHRLEEYLIMTARVLEIDGQFLYVPDCMLISFDDRSTHTTEVRLVRVSQDINLGKLKDVHAIYKEVMHDVICVEEGIRRLDEAMTSADKFRAWARVFVFGLTSAFCAPFSFSAGLMDIPLAFCLGCLVGLLQIVVKPRSNMYSHIFEVTATIVVSFLARAFGSINDGNLFCFSALAQSGIVMLLPGFSVLCSALELQSRAIVPGSIRIVYAIIYSLLLGFGITVGACLYGLFDNNATSATTCSNPLPSNYGFIFVPFFVLSVSIVLQAKWRQMPMMVLVAFVGYVVNFFSSLKFVGNPQISNTIGALSVGILANLDSRLRRGLAAATLIPAILTQVPGGLASTGGLLSGLSAANRLTNSSAVINGTSKVHFNPGDSLNTVVFNVAASMIQIAIGISVGLFLSALVVYPLGKRRSGLFSF